MQTAKPQPVLQGVLKQVLPFIVSDWTEVGHGRAFASLPPLVSRYWCSGKGPDLERQCCAAEAAAKRCVWATSLLKLSSEA